jgi:hypothetical protein
MVCDKKILKMVEDHEDAPKSECGKCFAELKDDAKYRLRWKLKTDPIPFLSRSPSDSLPFLNTNKILFLYEEI